MPALRYFNLGLHVRRDLIDPLGGTAMSEMLNDLVRQAVKRKLSRRGFIGRAGALGLSAAAANTLLAGAVWADGPKQGGTLRLGLSGGASSDTLDPALAAGLVPSQMTRQFGDTLVNVTPTGEIEYRLAESVENSDDAVTWYFHIRKGVEFHDGRTLTAEDVLKTLQRHSNEASQSQAFGLLQNIISMRADGDIVEIALDAPNADFAYMMAERVLVMQAGGGFDSPADGNGTGPYKIIEAAPGVRYLCYLYAPVQRRLEQARA